MNIYNIQQELLDIFSELEENGGELTPELDSRLTIAQEDFKDKIESYTHVIASYNADINFIKAEQKRLKDLADKKVKVVERLTKVMIEAIDQFGDTKKSGAKFVDFGTGVVSVRNSKAVQFNEDLLTNIDEGLDDLIKDLHLTNSLDVVDKLDEDKLIKCSIIPEFEDDGVPVLHTSVCPDDLDYMDVEFKTKVPLRDLLNGKSYPIIRELARNSTVSHKTSASKSFLKGELEQNGSCAPNLARLVINKSISIK